MVVWMTRFFDKKAAEWRAEQARRRQAIGAHNSADRTYMDEGVRLLELARRAYELFRKQEPGEKTAAAEFPTLELDVAGWNALGDFPTTI